MRFAWNSTGKQILGLLIVSLLLVRPSAIAGADGWVPVAPSVDYQLFKLPGPVQVHVTRMDRSDPTLTLEAGLANRQLEGGLQTVSEMVEMYDGTLSGWEPNWGGRMEVLAAINGSFHDQDTGRPDSGMIQGGWYIKRFNDLGGGSGFGWRLDGSAFIGGCVRQGEDQHRVTVVDTGEYHPIGAINSRPKSREMALYTHHYGRRGPGRNAVQVMVLMEYPPTILSIPRMAMGTVTSVEFNAGSRPLPFDQIMLRGQGEAGEWLRKHALVGTELGISTGIDHYQSDCETPHPESWDETYTSLSGSFEFLLDGEIQSFDDLGANVDNPRTAICYNDRHLHFVVVDGRQEGFSRGMTIEELGAFCRDRLDADWGINQDGGGSSAMWVAGEIVNSPSDGHERPIANGLMLVRILRKEQSRAFRAGDAVRTRDLVDLSVGPGSNFQTPWDVEDGASGLIVSDPHRLDGIRATGAYWWKVDFGDRVGWVTEANLESLEGSAATPTPTTTPQPIDDLKTLLASDPWLEARAYQLHGLGLPVP